MFSTPSGDLMWKFTGLGYFGTVSHCTPVLVSQCSPNDGHFYLVHILGKLDHQALHFTPIVCKVVTYVINDISSTKQLSTVEITEEGKKITTKVKKVTFSNQIYSYNNFFLTRSRKKEGVPDINLIRS